jgi:RNA polymerase sigma-70 factor (ECF subfamily)
MSGTDAGLLFTRHGGRVHRFCVRRLNNEDEAADAVQDTFLRAWLALREGAEVRHPLPWLLTIADNVCVSRFRARGARIATTELFPETRVEAAETAGDVTSLVAALRKLPERQRRALLGHELQGYSYDEIGAELGVSRASVAGLINRGRSAVTDILRDVQRGRGAAAAETSRG